MTEITAEKKHRPFGICVDGPLGPDSPNHQGAVEHEGDSFDVIVARRNPDAHVEFTVTREVFDNHFAHDGFIVHRVIGTYNYDGEYECFRFTEATR